MLHHSVVCDYVRSGRVLMLCFTVRLRKSIAEILSQLDCILVTKTCRVPLVEMY